MDIEVFVKRVYTVSFRLTGQEQVAEEIASQAIIHTFKEMDEDYKEKVTENMFHLTIKIHDNIPVSDYTYEELYEELVCGRKELNEYKISIE
jgi:hypothetical protein